ncbi:zf-PARP-domain-containing protein [Xylariaceae sp. AK1471]|nr:zf-PARP-domain-containing protein [Xylariaceae sp. AK1471]
MSSYRIELSANNRAGCQDKVCKDSGNKITKGELRLGVWFTMPGTEHGSWKWRHWGCVSGKTISNIQESIGKDGDYDWDMLDGYDEIPDADIQEKIRRVVNQGHIDAEDFNGDPDFNLPGKTAIRGRAKKPKADEDESDGEATTPKKAAPKKAAGAKRGRKKAEEDEDEDEEEAEPVKKKAKAGRKAKKSEEDDEEELEVQPVKKARAGRKTKKAEDNNEDEQVVQPVKKARAGRKAKQPVEEDEDEVEEPEKPAPPKKRLGKKVAAKKEPTPPSADEEDEDEEPVVKTIAKGKAGRKTKAAATPVKGGRRGRSGAKVGDNE